MTELEARVGLYGYDSGSPVVSLLLDARGEEYCSKIWAENGDVALLPLFGLALHAMA
jgi:hypothetical protein